MFCRILRPALVPALLALWLLGLVVPALAQPTLTHTLPHAIAPGKTTELALHGAKLDSSLRLWTSFPAQVEFAPTDASQKDRTQVTCKITLPPNCQMGIGGIAVASANGLSDPIYLLIDDLPSTPSGSDHHSAAQAQEITLPMAIDGQSNGTLSDYVRFSAKAGQQISCEVLGTRLGWDFDSLVRVLDAAGNELLLSDDDAATGPDTRFVFVAPRDGVYVLELRDNRFKPGGRYRLRVGDFPLVSTPAPLVAQRNAAVELKFRGLLTEVMPPATILPLEDSVMASAFNLTAGSPTRRASSWAALSLTDFTVVTENSAAGKPTGLQVPAFAAGILETARERDLFPFGAKKGVPHRFRAMTRSAGSPAILSLRVLDAAGKQLAESPVTDSDEPVLSFSPPADGSFQLAVEELAGRGGADYTYAVECTTGPQFALLMKNDKNNRLKHSLPIGGAFYLDVQCQRVGYDGPIILALESARSGWQLANNTIPAKANEVRLYVQPPVDLSTAEIASLWIIGRAPISGRDFTTSMSTTLQLRAARPQTPYPPRWHDGAVFVSGTGPKSGFFTVTNKATNIDVAQASEKAQLTIDFERTDAKFKDTPLTIVPLSLPAGVTAEIKRNGNGPKETYDINLKLPKDLPVGQHAIRYFAFAELSGQGRGILSGDLLLNVTKE